LILIFILLSNGLEIRSYDFFHEHQFLFFELLHKLEVVYHLLAKLLLGLCLKVGLVNKFLFLLVEIVLSLKWFCIFLFAVYAHERVAKFEGVVIDILDLYNF